MTSHPRVSPLALYDRDGGLFVPRPAAAGPWQQGTQNGGAVGALLATVGESVDADAGLVPMAIHIELLRPSPLSPLLPSVTVLRNGKRLHVVRVVLSAGSVDVAAATLVRLRPEGAALSTVALVAGIPPPELCARESLASPFFSIVECRIAAGGFQRTGPGAAWMRMQGEVVAGAAATPFAAAVLMADAGSGLSSLVSREQWAFPNVTLSLHMHRAIVGHWLYLQSETITAGVGLAQVHTQLSDTTGKIGYAHQTLCLAPR